MWGWNTIGIGVSDSAEMANYELNSCCLNASPSLAELSYGESSHWRPQELNFIPPFAQITLPVHHEASSWQSIATTPAISQS